MDTEHRQLTSDDSLVEILPQTRRYRLEESGLASFDGSSITYHRVHYTDNLADPEEKVRADLYLDLVEKYGYFSEDCIVMEKYHKIGHPRKKSDAKIDILVNYPDGKPFMVIELKSPEDYEDYMETSIQTQLFNLAAVENQGHNSIRYLLYHTRFWEGLRLREKTICIDYSKYQSFDQWNTAGRQNLRAIPEKYGIVRVPKFIKGGEHDLRTDVQRDELQRVRKDLHNILWGGGKYQNELFFNLVGLFLVKIYDEKETVEGEAYQFQIFFQDGAAESSDTVYDRMNELYFRALQQYLGYTKDELRKIKDIVFDSQKVRYVVEVLQDISFTVNRFDVIGDFFEGIVRGEFKQSKGQYLTHTNLVQFMVQGLRVGDLALELVNNEKRLPYIIDPACGSGAFLIECMKVITEHVMSRQDLVRKSSSVRDLTAEMFPEFRHNAWARHYVYGIEINGDLAAATKVNMVGHGDGSANIEAKDALIPFRDFSLGMLQISKPSDVYPLIVNEQFDIVLSNPPFSITVDRDTARTFPESYIQGEEILRRLRSENELEVATELLFIERYYQLLRPGGRLAVVLPESVFDTSSNRGIRLFLFKYFKVFGIISLTAEAFSPYTTTKTNILFAEKKTNAEVLRWNEAWERHIMRYRKLRYEIRKYLEQPSIYRKITEIVGKYSKEVGIDYDDNVQDEVATTVVNYIREKSGFGESPNLMEEVVSLITDYFEDATEKQREELGAIIQRKQSLKPALEEYVGLVRSKEKLVELLEDLLGEFFDSGHKDLTISELINEYDEDIRYADEYWWVFKFVTKELPKYRTILAHAEKIGYKRGVRGEENRPNELFSMSEDIIEIDVQDPKTILDEFVANVRWRSATERSI